MVSCFPDLRLNISSLYLSISVKYLFIAFAHFFYQDVCFSLLIYRRSSCILDTNTLSAKGFSNDIK